LQKKNAVRRVNPLITRDPRERDVFTMVLLFFESLARWNRSRGFTHDGLDGWGFGILRMLRRSRFVSQDKSIVMQRLDNVSDST